MTLPAMVAKTPVQIAWSSDRVILEMKGRINSGASLCNKEEAYSKNYLEVFQNERVQKQQMAYWSKELVIKYY